jgi:hypothetical protein
MIGLAFLANGLFERQVLESPSKSENPGTSTIEPPKVD